MSLSAWIVAHSQDRPTLAPPLLFYSAKAQSLSLPALPPVQTTTWSQFAPALRSSLQHPTQNFALKAPSLTFQAKYRSVPPHTQDTSSAECLFGT